MRLLIVLSGTALVAAIVYLSTGGHRQSVSSPLTFEAVAKNALGEVLKSPASMLRMAESEQSAPDVPTPEVPAPLGTLLSGRDREEIATHLTPTAEFVDRQGHVYRGRESIANELATVFSQGSAGQTESQMDSLRIVESGLVIEDGFTTTVQSGGDEPAIRTRYTAVEVLQGGKWYVASVRERPWTRTPPPSRSNEGENTSAQPASLRGD
jgi:ketosteroid isomerase-like protein